LKNQFILNIIIQIILGIFHNIFCSFVRYVSILNSNKTHHGFTGKHFHGWLEHVLKQTGEFDHELELFILLLTFPKII